MMKNFEWIFDSNFKPIFLWLSVMSIIFLEENYKELSQFDFSIMTKFLVDNWIMIGGALIITLILTFIIQRFLVLKKKTNEKKLHFLALQQKVMTDF